MLVITENQDMENNVNIKKGLVITSFFFTGVLAIYFLMLAIVGFQIDITGIKPGAIINYNPNMAAAFISLALSSISIVISGILFKKIIKIDLSGIGSLIDITNIFAAILGFIAVGVNIYLIIEMKHEAIFWPYILFLMIKNPVPLSGQLFLLHDFNILINICFYMYLVIVMVSPGLSCLLTKFKSFNTAENRLSSNSGIWIIIVSLFPYLMIPMSLMVKNSRKV